MDLSNYNACNCDYQPANYSSTSFGGQFPGLNVPANGQTLTFTSTDFSQELACGMGREISFSAFMQMGSSLGAAAEAMIILAMNQCNNVLNENEALIAGPASSTSSTTTTTIYHEKVCSTDKGAPAGATDAYIQNYKGADGKIHQEITYVDANGKEVGKRDFVLDNNAALGTVTLTTDANGDGKIDAGDTVTINGQKYILVDTGKTDCDGNKVYSLDTVDANGKDTGQSVGTVSFNANGTVDHSSILDYSTIAGDKFIPQSSSVPYTAISDSFTYNGLLYIRDPADDKAGGLFAYKNATTGAIIYADNSTRGPNTTIYVFAAASGIPDAYATYNQGGKGVSLKELGSNSAPTDNSTSTTSVNQNTADPLTTMAAVFKYAEVYAEAMTMMSVYYQNNIDNFKNRPH